MFPSGYFYLVCRKNGYVLDVYDGSIKAGANIIMWPQKFADSDNQLWSYDRGRLVNKKSGHVMDIQSGAFKKDKTIVQNKPKDKHQTQEWGFDNGFIFSVVYPTMVLEIKSEDGGAQVLLTHKKNTDNLSQKWFIEPYHQFQASLSMAADARPLHKRPDFGVPRLGYGAEVGAPSELTALPPNIKVVGVNGVASRPTVYISPTAYNMGSQQLETLAPGSNYSAPQVNQAQPSNQATTAPSAQYPPAYSTGNAYHSTSTGGYPQTNPPPVASAGYPPAPPASHGHGNYSTPQSPNAAYQAHSPTFSSTFQQSSAYPVYSSSPPSYGGAGVQRPQNQSACTSPPVKHNTSTYPPPASAGGYSSSPKQNPSTAYPPAPGYAGHQSFPHQQSAGYPFASSNHSGGYPPVSGAGGSGSGYPPQQPGENYPAQQPGGGYPAQQPGGGYPAQQPGGGYPPQQPGGGGYPPQQPGGGGYPPQQPAVGYPPQQPGAGYPSQQPGGGYPPQQPGGGYPQQQPGAAYPPQQPGGGYPQQPPVGGFFAPPLPQRQQSGMQMHGAGYPPANYPPYPPN